MDLTPLSARLIDADDLPIGLIDIELSMPPTELVGGTAVIMLRPEEGPPAAVLKVARGPLGAAELRTQRRVLTDLAIQQGLGAAVFGQPYEVPSIHKRVDVAKAILDRYVGT